uniref:Uncharacterized protein n=1 Tax=Romanomermis culicivorax TaxID=13658 RepID=A0A915L9A7_ROMCU
MDVLDILDDIDEEDIDDYVRIRTISDRTNPLEKYSDTEFWIRYKLTKNNAIKRLALLEENLLEKKNFAKMNNDFVDEDIEDQVQENEKSLLCPKTCYYKLDCDSTINLQHGFA